MKLSVAMCTYNGAGYLRPQLASIAGQTRRPDELVVCDDTSQDGTQEIVAAFAAEVSFPVRLYSNQKNLGSNKNFEQAINLCEGDVIALCDQDDIWHAEKLAVMESVFAAQPEAGLVFTNGEVIDQNSVSANYTLWEGVGFDPQAQKRLRAGRAFEVLNQRSAISGAAMAFRARFTKLVLPIPEGIGFVHDEWIALLIAAGAEVAMIDKPLIRYRRHASQQIGVSEPASGPGEGMIEEVRQAIQRENPFALEIRKLQAIEDRLRTKRDEFPCDEAYRLVRGRLAHLEARASMLEPGLHSVLSVLRELLTLRYHRYSRGIFSAIKDLRSIAFSRAHSI